MMCKIFIFRVTLAFVLTITCFTIALRVPLTNEDTFEDAEKAINSSPPPPSFDPLLSSSSSVSENNQRIINGNEALPHSRTYQAGLIIRRLRNGFQTQHICGGAVLAKNVILTTGFCIEHSHTVVAVLGAHFLFDEREKTQQRFTLTQNEYIFHPAYDSSTMSNDIALLRLPSNAIFNEFVQPIELPAAENMIEKSFVGASVDVAGKLN
jgi:V8-like Glu-specific endopeptidase